jgi:hypothetical protein
MKLTLLACTAALLLALPATAQVYSNKVVGEKNQAYIDSLEKTEYPYLFPFYGEAVTKKGFDLPYSAGFSATYMTQKSDLVIENLYVGFNDGPMYDMSQVVRFNAATSKASGFNVRPDLWILPFLNVYGVFMLAQTSTSIDASMWLPEADGTWSEQTTFSSTAEFDAQSAGFGLTPTVGVAGGWMAFDMNFVWTDISALDKPAYSFVFGPRFGKTFTLDTPERNFALWVGGFRLKIASSTSGSLNLADVLPIDGLQAKVDDGIQRVGEAQQQVDTWWNGLSQIEQTNPVNKAKYEAANNALTKAGDFLSGLDGALNDDQMTTVQYSLDKRPKDMWNFLVGAQFQLNKHWMIRGEYGFLGSRQQFIGGLQYRFGL